MICSGYAIDITARTTHVKMNYYQHGRTTTTCIVVGRGHVYVVRVDDERLASVTRAVVRTWTDAGVVTRHIVVYTRTGHEAPPHHERLSSQLSPSETTTTCEKLKTIQTPYGGSGGVVMCALNRRHLARQRLTTRNMRVMNTRGWNCFLWVIPRARAFSTSFAPPPPCNRRR